MIRRQLGWLTAWMAPFALLAFATACASDAGSGTSTPPADSEVSATAGTAVARGPIGAAQAKSTPAPSKRPKARYLERCAANVCRLVHRNQAYTDGDDGLSPGTSWSPDRTRWATLSTPPVDPGPGRAALYVGEPTAGAVRALLEVERQHDEVAPVWSPDGSMLAFEAPLAQALGTATTLDVVTIDGGSRRTVSPPDASYACCASSSPDDSQIVMSVTRLGQANGSLVIAPVTGGAGRSLATPGLSAWTPSWRAGDVIAFTAQPVAGGQFDLYAVNSDGTGLRRLTTEGAFVQPVGHWPLVVSEDRRCIAYLSDRGGLGVWTQCLGGTERLAARLSSAGRYVWLTDGRLAVFFPGECAGVLAVRVETEERDCIVY